ncbi:hypothetical protein PMAYCL1PPCAC_03476, partial [Pristionchus mayeri]
QHPDLAKLDKRRLKKIGRMNPQRVELVLRDSKDTRIKKVLSLLSTSITIVALHRIPSSYLSLCDQLLRSSSINILNILDLNLNDATAPHVLSISSHAKSIILRRENFNSQLSDPASFIAQLGSMPRFSSVSLSNASSFLFFDLPTSFWKKYLNEAPIDIRSDGRITSLRWQKKHSK